MQVDAPTWLRGRKLWLTWKYERDANDAPTAKPRKVPYYPDGTRRAGQQGAAADLARLTTFEQARAAATRRGHDGVGLALVERAGIVAVDFDNCVVDGVIHPEVVEITLGTYAEFSPSGTGIRAFYMGPSMGNNKDAHGEPYGVEIFSTRGYVTFTGCPTPDTDMLDCTDLVAPVTDRLQALVAKRFGTGRVAPSTGDALMDYQPVVGVSPDDIQAMLAQLNPDMSRDKWLQVGMAIHHEMAGSSEGFALWDQWSRGSAKYGVGQPIERVWESFKRDGTSGGAVVTMATVKKLVAQSVGEVEMDQPLESTPPAAPHIPYQVIPADEFASRPIPAWLMYGVLPRQHVGMVYGASGSGKSFIVLDMCMAHARGIQWRGLSTAQCGVTYVAAEGAGGFVKRVRAYCQHHNVDMSEVSKWFGVIDGAPDFMDVEEVKRVRAAIDARVHATGVPVGLIVLDTLSRVTPDADEQSKEMGVALDLATRLAKSTGALVLIVHHSGKDATRGARGWSGMKAAMDVELEVARADDHGLVRCLTVSKSKDGEDGEQFFFSLESVELGVDADLNVITSAIVKTVEPPAADDAKGSKPLTGLRLKIYNHVTSLGQNTGIEPEAIVDEIVAGMPKVEGKRDTRKQVVKKALTDLCTEGYFAVVDGCIDLIVGE
jgi:KaiC/GvpD/RAD55 family RecA-like ATPase